MIKKGEVTRNAILETAKELFSKKGYSAVTMQDFCERNELSRGGLYRHFASTKEIFIAMLDCDKENSSLELDKAILAQVPAKQMINRFVNNQKQEIQKCGGRLSIAIYEFCTIEVDQKGYMENRFTSAVDILTKLIQYGQSRQEFLECDAKEIAAHIVVFLEGFRLSSAVIPFSDIMIENQLKVIYKMVVGDDK